MKHPNFAIFSCCAVFAGPLFAADGPADPVRELLSHTAGFTDYPRQFDERKDYTEEDLLKRVESIPLTYPPGTAWRYSNLGYLTLGILIHRVTGEFYGDFLRQRIFVPLGMATTLIIDEAAIIPHRSAGYRWVHGEVENQKWVSPSLNTTADDSLYFSILDLAKWDAAPYTEQILKQSSLAQRWKVVVLTNLAQAKPDRIAHRVAEMYLQNGGTR